MDSLGAQMGQPYYMGTTPQSLSPAASESSVFMGLSGFFWGLAASFAVGVTMVRKHFSDRSQNSDLELGMVPRRAGVPTMVEEIVTEQQMKVKQNFLEADPYWDQKTIPVNTYK